MAAAGGAGRDLPDPAKVGRHEPDALGLDRLGWVAGEVKRGPELFDRHTQEQLYDFTRLVERRGRPVRLLLVVPGPYRVAARQAVREAGGRVDRVTIVSPLRRRVEAPRPRRTAARS
ncbi:MAG: hypothetical protein ACRDPC_10715 [Solirubrobacteraceae bacterium]